MDLSIKEKYNNTANAYSKRENSIYQFSHHLRAVSLELQKNKYDAIIDIGCGSGAVIRRLSSQYSNLSFIGVDFSEELIDIANKLNKNKNLQFYISDFSNNGSVFVNTISKSFQNIMVLVHGALEYYDEKDTFTQEIVKLVNSSSSKTIILFFLNKEMIFRSFLKGNNKKYWSAKTVCKLFNCDKGEFELRYRSLLIFDSLITKSKFWDKFFLGIDSLINKLPACIAKKITTTFEITISKK